MTKKRVLVASVLSLLGAFVSCTRADKDLNLTVAALHHVNSWHEEYDGPGSVAGTWEHRVSDVVCSKGEHVVMDETAADSRETHAELFYTPHNSYYHQPYGSYGWQKWGNGRAPECSAEPQLIGLGVALHLEEVLEGAAVRRGEARSAGSELCREYNVKGIWKEFTICINESDHLPREIVSSFFKDEAGEWIKPQRASYSRWNGVNESDLPSGAPAD